MGEIEGDGVPLAKIVCIRSLQFEEEKPMEVVGCATAGLSTILECFGGWVVDCRDEEGNLSLGGEVSKERRVLFSRDPLVIRFDSGARGGSADGGRLFLFMSKLLLSFSFSLG